MSRRLLVNDVVLVRCCDDTVGVASTTESHRTVAERGMIDCSVVKTVVFRQMSCDSLTV